MNTFWPDANKTVRVTIITVDSRTRQVEATLRDGAAITLGVWETPAFFRWPREGEEWTAIHENGFWRLGIFNGTENDPVVDLLPGQARVDADSLYIAGNTFVQGQPVVVGDDTRLIDSRTPVGPAGGILAGTYPNPGFAQDMATQAELDASNVASSGALATHAALTTLAHGGIVADTDPRLTNDRAPIGPAGGVLSGIYPNPGFAASPAFTGVPTSPTAALNTNTTQLATTAFVASRFANAIGAWTPNITPGVMTQVNSHTFAKTGGVNGEWDGQVYSTEGFVQNCFVTWRALSTAPFFMIGLNSDPASSASYEGIDYALYCFAGALYSCESGALTGLAGLYTTADVLSVTYDGVNVRYWRNGTLLRSIPRAVGVPLYLDSSFYHSQASPQTWGATNLHYGAMREATEPMPFVTLAPGMAGRNIVQPISAGVIPFTLKGALSQTGNLQEWQDSTGAVLASVLASGDFSARLLAVNTLATTATVGLRIGTSGASVSQFQIMPQGISLGDGTTLDTSLYRASANALKTNGIFKAVGEIESQSYVRAFNIDAAPQANAVILGYNGNASAPAIAFGSAFDTNLYRAAANLLKTDDNLHVVGDTVSGSGDAVRQIQMTSLSGLYPALVFGTTADTNLYRLSAGVLATDSDFRFAASGRRLTFMSAANRWNVDGLNGNFRVYREDLDGTAGSVKLSITDAGAVTFGGALTSDANPSLTFGVSYSKAAQHEFLKTFNATDGQDWSLYRPANTRDLVFSTLAGESVTLSQAGGVAIAGALSVGGALTPTGGISGLTALHVAPSGTAQDTSGYSILGVTRPHDPTNALAYIGLTKTGVVPLGIGINVANEMTFGLSTVATHVLTPYLTVGATFAKSGLAKIGTHPTYGAGFAALWKDGLDYAVLMDNTNTYLNAPISGGSLRFRLGNVDQMALASGLLTMTGNISVSGAVDVDLIRPQADARLKLQGGLSGAGLIEMWDRISVSGAHSFGSFPDPGAGGIYVNGAILADGIIYCGNSGYRNRNSGNNTHIDAIGGAGGIGAMYLNYFGGTNVYFGSGANTIVATMSAAGSLTMNGTLGVGGDNIWQQGAFGSGGLYFGPGAATRLYSPSANVLRTPGGFVVDGDYVVIGNGSGVGGRIRSGGGDLLDFVSGDNARWNAVRAGSFTTTTGDLTFGTSRAGAVGVYDPTNTQAVWAMGPAYVLTPGGASNVYGNTYGLYWSYNPNFGGTGNNPQSKAGLEHQLLAMNNGVTQTSIGTGIWTIGNIQALGSCGFNGAAPSRPNITGARSEPIYDQNVGASVSVANDVVLTNLLTALHNMGIINDQTFAA